MNEMVKMNKMIEMLLEIKMELIIFRFPFYTATIFGLIV